MEIKKLNHLLKTLEITLHSLHEEVREHNKDYFMDDGQEYPVPTVSAERQKDVVDKIRRDLKNNVTEKYIDVREKSQPWVRKLNPNYKPTNRRRIT